eukprot:103487_1
MSTDTMTTSDTDLELTTSSFSISHSIPKKINLSIKTEAELTSISSSIDISKSMKSLTTIPSSASSTSSTSSSISSILNIEDNTPISPLHLSQHSTPNFTFNKSKLDNKINKSDLINLSPFSSGSSPNVLNETRSASQPPIILHHSDDEDNEESESDNNEVEDNTKHSFSIFTFLRNEIEYIDVATTPIINQSNLETNEINIKHSAEERIYNFFWLFFKIEKLLFFSFWICCDSFLLIITILPTRVLYRIYMKLSYLIQNEWLLFYNNFIRYYALYFYYTLKYCFLWSILCKIYDIFIYIITLQFIIDLLLFIFCCNMG